MRRFLTLLSATTLLLLGAWWSISAFREMQRQARLTPLNNALIEAAWANDLPGVNAQLAKGASANALDGWAVYGAADAGHASMVRFLLEHGANPNAGSHTGDCALDRAACGDHVATAEVLLQFGAPVNSRDNHHLDTPLIWAACWHASHTMEFLIQRGADVNARNDVGMSPLHCLLELQPLDMDAVPCVAILLKRHADVNAADWEGKTALMRAAEQGLVHTARMLVDGGADLTLRDRDGRTARDFVSPNGPPALRSLLQPGGNR